MKIGYARVSTKEQNLDMQVEALKKAGCERIFTEKKSGVAQKREVLIYMFEHELRKGDTLVVWKLDRLGRSLKELVLRVDKLKDMGIGFESLTERIETETPQGRLLLGIFSVLAEFERNLIAERTKAGLEAAKARGQKLGKPKVETEEQKFRRERVKALHTIGMTIDQIAKELKCGYMTVVRDMERLELKAQRGRPKKLNRQK